MILQEAANIGEVILHDTADAYAIGIEPFFRISWHRWPDLTLGPVTVNLTPTKHAIFLIVASTTYLCYRARWMRSMFSPASLARRISWRANSSVSG